MKVVINLFFTQFLDKGLHNGYRLAINIRNAASSPKKNEWLFANIVKLKQDRNGTFLMFALAS
jgi:hypothetical protein